MAANKKIFISPGEGAHLPVLDITHKVTAQSLGGAFTIMEVGLAPGEMICNDVGGQNRRIRR